MALVTRLADHFGVSVLFLVGEEIEAPMPTLSCNGCSARHATSTREWHPGQHDVVAAGKSVRQLMSLTLDRMVAIEAEGSARSPELRNMSRRLQGSSSAASLLFVPLHGPSTSYVRCGSPERRRDRKLLCVRDAGLEIGRIAAVPVDAWRSALRNLGADTKGLEGALITTRAPGDDARGGCLQCGQAI